MFNSSFLKAGAIGAMVTAMLATAIPVQAQDRGGRDGRSWGGQRAERVERAQRPQRAERPQRSERAERRQRSERGNWGGGERRRDQAAQANRQPRPQPGPQAERRGNYGADRDRSYGANARGGDRSVQRQRGQVDARAQQSQRSDRNAYRQGYQQGRQQDWRDDRRDQRQAYNQGYRAGDRADNRRDGRWGGDNRRWDNRSWRNDNRYDWQRYRASNRAIFRPGRYYAPYSNYSYSRVNIGFRLGSSFYSNRYWINDPWQYRLPPAYGSYRWVRYYDDALLVDIYSGQVVDVINDFFW